MREREREKREGARETGREIQSRARQREGAFKGGREEEEHLRETARDGEKQRGRSTSRVKDSESERGKEVRRERERGREREREREGNTNETMRHKQNSSTNETGTCQGIYYHISISRQSLPKQKARATRGLQGQTCRRA